MKIRIAGMSSLLAICMVLAQSVYSESWTCSGKPTFGTGVTANVTGVGGVTGVTSVSISNSTLQTYELRLKYRTTDNPGTCVQQSDQFYQTTTGFFPSVTWYRTLDSYASVLAACTTTGNQTGQAWIGSLGSGTCDGSSCF